MKTRFQRKEEERTLAMQELWFSTLRRPWTSLVLVPGDETVSVVELAQELAQVGSQQQGRMVEVLIPNLEHLQASKDLSQMLKAAQARVADGPQVLVALEPVITRPAGVAAALAADAVLVCVAKGRTRLKLAKKTVEMIGRDRLTGCVLMNT